MSKVRSLLGVIIFFLIYLGVVIFLQTKLPKPEEFIDLIKGFYGSYGYQIVFLAGLLEATFLIGFQVPGSTVVLLGAAISRTGAIAFPLVFILGISGLLTGYTINYFLGRHGWYHLLARFGLERAIEAAKKRLERHGIRIMLVGYVTPGFATLLSTTAGVIRMPFRKFFGVSIIAQSAWSFFWGGLAYLIGLPLLVFVSRYLIFVFVGIGFLWLLVKWIKKR